MPAGISYPLALLVLIGSLASSAGLAQAEDEVPPLPGPFKNIHIIDFKGEIDVMMHVYVFQSSFTVAF